ncbi:MAG: tyrosine-type recombinase/integrase, partial [Bacillota bacterium]|nr:tyrosine-type recombinase/integrase [Bacillota bacterium]
AAMQCFLSYKGLFYCINISFSVNRPFLALLQFHIVFPIRCCLAVLSALVLKLPGTIDIIREEVKTYIKYENGSIHRNGYEVVNHTKTQCGKRKLILTPVAKKYIQMAIERNKELGISDEDSIFLNKKGDRLHDHAVNNVLRRLNGVKNEKDSFVITARPRGNHAIRKTCISELHNSRLLSDDTIKTFAGHKDISTTQKCYIHQVKPITEYADVFTEVFDSS